MGLRSPNAVATSWANWLVRWLLVWFGALSLLAGLVEIASFGPFLSGLRDLQMLSAGSMLPLWIKVFSPYGLTALISWAIAILLANQALHAHPQLSQAFDRISFSHRGRSGRGLTGWLNRRILPEATCILITNSAIRVGKTEVRTRDVSGAALHGERASEAVWPLSTILRIYDASMRTGFGRMTRGAELRLYAHGTYVPAAWSPDPERLIPIQSCIMAAANGALETNALAVSDYGVRHYDRATFVPISRHKWLTSGPDSKAVGVPYDPVAVIDLCIFCVEAYGTSIMTGNDSYKPSVTGLRTKLLEVRDLLWELQMWRDWSAEDGREKLWNRTLAAGRTAFSFSDQCAGFDQIQLRASSGKPDEYPLSSSQELWLKSSQMLFECLLPLPSIFDKDQKEFIVIELQDKKIWRRGPVLIES